LVVLAVAVVVLAQSHAAALVWLNVLVYPALLKVRLAEALPRLLQALYPLGRSAATSARNVGAAVGGLPVIGPASTVLALWAFNVAETVPEEVTAADGVLLRTVPSPVNVMLVTVPTGFATHEVLPEPSVWRMFVFDPAVEGNVNVQLAVAAPWTVVVKALVWARMIDPAADETVPTVTAAGRESVHEPDPVIGLDPVTEICPVVPASPTLVT